MLAGLPAAILLLAPAASAVPSSPTPPPPATARAADGCSPTKPNPNSSEIVICAPKVEGYRIDPDVLSAKRQKRANQSGRPRPPERMADTSCQVVGPAPCIGAPMINILGAAATIAEMAQRLSTGQEIGSMFQTTPEPTEYQLYLQAKAKREAEEAEKAAKAKAKATAAK